MKKTIDASDYATWPDYQDSSAIWIILIVTCLIALIAAIFIASYTEQTKFYNTHTCDEIAIKISNNAHNYEGKYYEKCMKDVFPNKYPTQAQLQQYFINTDCTSLGVHILKRSFEYSQATSVYEIKCATPLQHLELPPVIIEQTAEPTVKHIKINQRYG